MKLTAYDLYELKVIDEIIKEPNGEMEKSFCVTAKNLKSKICKAIDELKPLSEIDIVENRYKKFRDIGEFKEIN